MNNLTNQKYSLITLTASCFGIGAYAEQYAGTSLQSALDNFNTKLEYLKKNNLQPGMEKQYTYNDGAIWVLDGIVCQK